MLALGQVDRGARQCHEQIVSRHPRRACKFLADRPVAALDGAGQRLHRADAFDVGKTGALQRDDDLQRLLVRQSGRFGKPQRQVVEYVQEIED